jgi:hypothetical protein
MFDSPLPFSCVPLCLQGQLLGSCWDRLEAALVSWPVDLAEMRAAHHRYLGEALRVCLVLEQGPSSPAAAAAAMAPEDAPTSDVLIGSVATALHACELYALACTPQQAPLNEASMSWFELLRACHQHLEGAVRGAMWQLQACAASDPSAAGLLAVLGCAFYDNASASLS